MKGKLMDVSVPVRPGMVSWPGDPELQIRRVKDFERGDDHVLSSLSMGAHAGTHVDAPAHFIRGGDTVDRAPLSVLVGPARVLEIRDPESIKAAELEGHEIKPGQRILFKTRNSAFRNDPEFHRDYVHVSLEAAEYLARSAVLLAGIDYLSVGGYNPQNTAVHLALLENGIWLIEGLDLCSVAPGNYELICLPLKLFGAEAAPARVLLRELE